MHLTDEERNSKHVTEERLLDLLKSSNVSVAKIGPDRNSFGEFLFIYLRLEIGPPFFTRCTGCGKDHGGPYRGIAFCGMGFDEKAHRYIEGDWRFFGAMDSSLETGRVVPVEEVLASIEKRKAIQIVFP